MLKTIATDGGEKHPAELAEETDQSMATIYRALKRLKGIVRNDNASVNFVSKKIEQEVAALVESATFQLENKADRVAKLLNVDARQAASSAWQQWLKKYAAEVGTVDDEKRVRIDTILSRLKATPEPRLEVVLDEAMDAWRKAGRDVAELREMGLEWRDAEKNWQAGKVAANLA